MKRQPCSDFVTKTNSPQPEPDLKYGNAPHPGTGVDDPVSQPTQSIFPLEWALTDPKGRSLSEVERLRAEESSEFLSERILARIQLAEAKAQTHDDLIGRQLDWHIVLHCMRGDAVECSPVTLSYYQVVGCHEDQYYDRVMIRRAAMFGDGNRVPFPRKQVASIKPKKAREA